MDTAWQLQQTEFTRFCRTEDSNRVYIDQIGVSYIDGRASVVFQIKIHLT